MNKLVIAAVGSIAALGQISLASASVNDDVRSCRTALAARLQLSASDFRVKFERFRDGRVRVVRLSLAPRAKDAKQLKAYCTIEKGAVTSLEIRDA